MTVDVAKAYINFLNKNNEKIFTIDLKVTVCSKTCKLSKYIEEMKKRYGDLKYELIGSDIKAKCITLIYSANSKQYRIDSVALLILNNDNDIQEIFENHFISINEQARSLNAEALGKASSLRNDTSNNR